MQSLQTATPQHEPVGWHCQLEGKVCDPVAEGGARGGDVLREGRQRDLLPLIEGTPVSSKYGAVKTDHNLFIASGAFYLATPSDLRSILTAPEYSLLKQYAAFMQTVGVNLAFDKSAVDALAERAADINERIENIGARRLATVLEKLLEEISFTASDRKGEEISVGASLVYEKVAYLARKGDLSRFVL